VRYDQGLIAEEVRPYIRDVYDHVVRINESVDTVRELLTAALERTSRSHRSGRTTS
jgi:magnesium transporter